MFLAFSVLQYKPDKHNRTHIIQVLIIIASLVVIHSIFVLGPSALGMGKSYLRQWKFQELTLHKEFLSCDIGTNNIRIYTSNYPRITIETTFLAQL